LLTPAARAQTDYFWNAPTGGTGTWNLSTGNWSSTSAGPVNYTWANTGSERANFGNTAGTVTLGTNITADGINFTTANYILAGGGNTLTLAGAGGVINTNVAATISAAIGGTVGLTKTGTGTLTLSGNNNYTGTTTASAGTLTMSGSNTIGGISAVTGATLTFSGNNTFGGPTAVNGGTLNLNGNNTLSGTTTVSDGTLTGTAQASGSPFGSAPITLNYGTLRLNGITSATTTTVGDLTVGAPSVNGAGVSNLIVNNSTGTVSTTFAAGNLVRGGPGSVLLITPFSGALGTGTTGEAITFTGGTSLTNGILPAWVVTQTSGSNPALDFTSYVNGVTTATAANAYTSTDLTTSNSSNVVNQTANVLATTGVSAYALKTNAGVAIDLGTNTLTLGNGSGQAGLIINNGGSVTDGNITFGSAEGLIHVSGSTTIGTAGAGSTITGNGLSFTASGTGTTTINSTITDNGGSPVTVAITGTTSSTNFVLNGPNSYTGGTSLSVNGTVSVGTDTAFGTGKVTNIAVPTAASLQQIQALGTGTRTLANAFDMNGNLTFTGTTNSIALNGPINIINPAAAGTRTLSNSMTTAGLSLTFGATPGSSTITLGNPVPNGGDGIGKGLTLAGSTNSTTVVNDVIQDPAAGGGAASGSLTISSNGTVSLNALNTYTGGTSLPAASTILPITLSSNALPGPSFTAGPFGTGPITVNNGTNQHFRPVGNQMISNQIIMTTGFAMDNATGDSSSLTFAGPITSTNAGKFISNGFTAGTAGGAMILGSPTAPSTITLPTVTGLNTSLAALAGPIVVNDVIQNFSPTIIGNVVINPNAGDNNTVTLNGANTYTGTTTLNAGVNTAGTGIIQIGVSSNALPGPSFTAGPFGTGTVTPNNTTVPPNLQPVGADRVVSNAISLNNSGFWASTASAAQDPTGSHNLTLAGQISEATASKIITNNMASGVDLILGASSAPNAIILGSSAGQSLTFQSTAGLGPTTIINDVIQNASGGGSGSLTVQQNATVVLNAANTYAGGTSVISGGRLFVANTSGSATGSGAVTVTGSGTVGSGGTFGGTGSVAGNVTISSTTAASQGGTIAPGTPTTIGTLTVGNILTLNPLGSYAFRYNGQTTTPAAGVDNNTINPTNTTTGTLDLSHLSSTSPFTVVLSGTPGSTVNTPVTFTAGTFGNFTLPAGFTSPGDVTSLFAFTGDYYTGAPVTATLTGNQLQFTFTPVPEPAHLLLVCGAVAGGLGWCRRRRA
jgi:autotransporter-associated beta strand protein